MKNKEITMPISIRMKHAEDELINNINKISQRYQLPAYLLDQLITNLHIEFQNQIIQEENEYHEKTKKESEEIKK